MSEERPSFKETVIDSTWVIVRYINIEGSQVINPDILIEPGRAAIFFGNGYLLFSNEGALWKDLEKAPDNEGVDLCVINEKGGALLVLPGKKPATTLGPETDEEFSLKTETAEYNIFR